jgi:hypothetical protein
MVPGLNKKSLRHGESISPGQVQSEEEFGMRAQDLLQGKLLRLWADRDGR